MKLIEPSVELITESDAYKKVELIGRTCYKSEDRISKDSAVKFVANLVKHQHFAMLEHAVVHFKLQGDERSIMALLDIPGVKHSIGNIDGERIHYVTLSLSHLYNPKWAHDPLIRAFYDMFCWSQGVSTDIELYIEEADVTATIVKDITKSNEFDSKVHQFVTIKFVCDRGVSHELVRHRCSVAQESTRYCNYSKEKFGGQIQFIYPAEFKEWNISTQTTFIALLTAAEMSYLQMLKQGSTPQQARAVLPNALKTEVILTMNVDQWLHFFQLRSLGVTGSPHPDMKVIADMAHDIFTEAISKSNIDPHTQSGT